MQPGELCVFRAYDPQEVGLGVPVGGVALKWDINGKRICVHRTTIQDSNFVLVSFIDNPDTETLRRFYGVDRFQLRRSAVVSDESFRMIGAVVRAVERAANESGPVHVRVLPRHPHLAHCRGVVAGWHFDRRRLNVWIQEVLYAVSLQYLAVCNAPGPHPEGGADL
jgi:hypothetical protein